MADEERRLRVIVNLCCPPPLESNFLRIAVYFSRRQRYFYPVPLHCAAVRIQLASATFLVIQKA
jgi:hypothetical protein